MMLLYAKRHELNCAGTAVCAGGHPFPLHTICARMPISVNRRRNPIRGEEERLESEH